MIFSGDPAANMNTLPSSNEITKERHGRVSAKRSGNNDRRIMYGSDFPNIPYAWDRELKRLARLVPDPIVRDSLFHSTALKHFRA